MKRLFARKVVALSLVLAFCALMLSGCIYGRVKYPLDRDVAQTRLGDKTGASSAHSIAWLVSWGDAGVARAAKNGDIQTINHLDGEIFIVLFGIYARQTTIAYGD
jgi:hypothetical protein